MKYTLKRRTLTATFITIELFVARANAAIFIDFVETGPNQVTVTASGAFNLSAVGSFSEVNAENQSFLNPSANLFINSPQDFVVRTYTLVDVFGSPAYGTVADFVEGSFISGINFGVSSQFDAIEFLATYVSGSNFTSIASFNTTFESLGVVDGSRSTVTFANGVISDTVTYRIGSAVPEPSSALLYGLGGVVAFTRRKRMN